MLKEKIVPGFSRKPRETQTHTPLSAVLLVLAALVGIVTAVVVYTFQVEYGPTTGSRIDGAIHGLTFAALPLAVAGVLAGVAFALGRRSSSLRGLAVAAIVLSIAGALVAGSEATVTKYDRLAKVPECGAADGGGARIARDAFAELEHPGPFGGGWSGVEGCGAEVLNVTLAQAATHYRDRLPAAGWQLTRDDASELAARRDGLVFVLNRQLRPGIGRGVGWPTPRRSRISADRRGRSATPSRTGLMVRWSRYSRDRVSRGG